MYTLAHLLILVGIFRYDTNNSAAQCITPQQSTLHHVHAETVHHYYLVPSSGDNTNDSTAHCVTTKQSTLHHVHAETVHHYYLMPNPGDHTNDSTAISRSLFFFFFFSSPFYNLDVKLLIQ